ncbi:hypothetical protein HYX18_01340 [Candidatus Woesearchaeota archaeon]|nr:hypothetical protein [Candidatus Woesearchaeota archaeon]
MVEVTKKINKPTHRIYLQELQSKKGRSITFKLNKIIPLDDLKGKIINCIEHIEVSKASV